MLNLRSTCLLKDFFGRLSQRVVVSLYEVSFIVEKVLLNYKA